MVIPKKLSQYKEIRAEFSDRNDAFKYNLNYFDMLKVVTCQQIHADKIALVKNPIKIYYSGCDGLVATSKVNLGIKTADCLPIFFYDPKKKIIAAVHAGWRGLLLNVIENVTTLLFSLGCQAKNILVCVGPHIKKCCYNVSYDTCSQFFGKFERNINIADYRNLKWFLNLEKISKLILLNSGLLEKNIEIMPWCTCCSSRFFSYRRDGINTGRMYNIIGFRNQK